MTPMSDNDIYDYIFIGSSPLSLLQALKSADEGARILVLNKQNQLGGCWSWMSQDGLAYERAAHLIEALPGVYDVLQQASGERFVDASTQPERQFSGLLKFKMAYFSKLFLLGALVKISLELVLSALSGRREMYFNSKVKLAHWFSVNPELLVSKLPKVKVPEAGYVAFIQGLVERCGEKGVAFQEGQIDECIDDGRVWLVKATNGTQWRAKHLVMASSVPMVETADGHLVAGTADMRQRLSVVLEIADQFRSRAFSYVSLVNHKQIKRIVDVTDKTQIPPGYGHYLFELSMTHSGLDKLSQSEMNALAVSSCLFQKNTAAQRRFSSISEYSIVTNGLTSRDRLTVLDSFGNLAVGVKAWAQL
jgi:protoporphyrinogen oxidase